jgi:hypothetical protein
VSRVVAETTGGGLSKLRPSKASKHHKNFIAYRVKKYQKFQTKKINKNNREEYN